MNLSVGIVGLPNAGKSTLFNALLKRQQAETAKHPFTTISPNKGIINVPDERLNKITNLTNIVKSTPASIEFIDIAGLVKEAHKGEGLGNQFLAHIREVNIILHVVRGFIDDSVTHIYQTIDPKRDMEIINTELLLADLGSINKAIDTHAKEPKILKFLFKIKENLNKGENHNDLQLNEEEKEFSKLFPLLWIKPKIIVINISEKDLSIANTFNIRPQPIIICAKLEEELAVLSPLEQQEFLKSYNLKQSGVETIIRTSFEKLNLITFYTIAKGKEARAWPVSKGTTALQAAGQVHTDFAKKFIKGHIVSFNDLTASGSWEKAREEGKLKIEGKDYFIQDGDIVEFKIGT